MEGRTVKNDHILEGGGLSKNTNLKHCKKRIILPSEQHANQHNTIAHET